MLDLIFKPVFSKFNAGYATGAIVIVASYELWPEHPFWVIAVFVVIVGFIGGWLADQMPK